MDRMLCEEGEGGGGENTVFYRGECFILVGFPRGQTLEDYSIL